MAEKASTTLIGAFVLGAVALAVAGLTVLGSGKLFQHRPKCVMFFSGSITGLSVGSPVEFRGVKVGEVTSIAAVFSPTDVSITIPVYVEFDPTAFVISRERQIPAEGDRSLPGASFYQPLLEKGLKAQLDIQSLLTRQLFISLDFHPELPTRLLGLEPRYAEIPTIPSLQEQLAATLHNVPDRLMSAIEGVDRLVNSPATQETFRQVTTVLRDLDELVHEVRAEVKPIATSVRATSDAARRSFAQAERTLSLERGPAAEMVASMTNTLQKAGASLDQLRSTLGSLEAVAAGNANLGYDLTRTLAQLDAAARAVRSLADYLELHPETVLQGKR